LSKYAWAILACSSKISYKDCLEQGEIFGQNFHKIKKDSNGSNWVKLTKQIILCILGFKGLILPFKKRK
jgi:hypothetical protein